MGHGKHYLLQQPCINGPVPPRQPSQSGLSPSVCSPRSYCDSPVFTYPSNAPYVESLQTHHSLPLHQPCHHLQHPIPPLPSQVLQPQQPFVQQPLIHQPPVHPIPVQSIPVQQPYPLQQLLPQAPSYPIPPNRFPHQPFQPQKTQLFPQSSPKSPGLNPVNYSMGSEFHQAFAFPSPSNMQGFQNVGLRQDLLMATDNVTDAVSSLVLELNTGSTNTFVIFAHRTNAQRIIASYCVNDCSNPVGAIFLNSSWVGMIVHDCV